MKFMKLMFIILSKGYITEEDNKNFYDVKAFH